MKTMRRSREDLDWSLELVSATYPDRVALVDGETGDRRTYGELNARVSRIASLLWSRGLRPGDTFGLLMHNCAEYLEILYGAARIGVTAVLVNRRLSPAEMAYELSDSRARGMIYSSKYDDSIAELRPLVKADLWWIRSGDPAPGEGADALAPAIAAAAESPPRPADTIDLADAGWVIIYTSGTTGKPKGVVLSQGNVAAANGSAARFIWAPYGIAQQPVVRALVSAGLNHIGGLCTSSAPVLAAGGQLVLMDDFDPKLMLRLLAEHRINLAFSIGAMWSRVLEEDLSAYDLSELRLIGTCISRHSEAELRRFRDDIGAEVYFMFGQTETTTGFVITRRTQDLFERPGTLGVPCGMMEMRLVDENGSPVAAGEVGELQYRGPSVFKEYFGRPDDTRAAFQDGWFRSGDLVRADADGYLYFVDRLKDMVKSGGLNVFTIEVEQMLADHPDIVEAAVAGLPDPVWGEAVTGFVVMRPGARFDAGAIADYCRQHIAAYKVPKRFYCVDEIPINALGKRMKRKLVEAALTGTFDPASAA